MGSSRAILVSAMAGHTAYRQCGTVQTNSASVRIVQSCTAPAIVAQPQSQNVAKGTSALLTVTATGPSLTYAWYQGTVLDYPQLRAEDLLYWQKRAFREWAMRPGPLWTFLKSLNSWHGLRSGIDIGLQTLGWVRSS